MDYYSDGGAMGLGHSHHHAFYSASIDPMRRTNVLIDDAAVAADGLDFMFSPHAIWPSHPEAAFFHPAGPGQAASASALSYASNGISEMTQLSVYSAPPAATIFPTHTLPPSPSPDPPVVANAEVIQSRTEAVGQKRKRGPVGKGQSSRKQQRTKSEDIQSISPTSDGASSGPSARPHYAVEKRYRSTLNERYATLARLLSNPETQEICRTECEGWEVPSKLEGSSQSPSEREGPVPKRQSKTTTLSVAIDTIALLDKCCTRKALEYQSLVNHLNAILQVTSAGVTVQS